MQCPKCGRKSNFFALLLADCPECGYNLFDQILGAFSRIGCILSLTGILILLGVCIWVLLAS